MPTRKVARSGSGMRGYDSPFARKASVEGRYSLIATGASFSS